MKNVSWLLRLVYRGLTGVPVSTVKPELLIFSPGFHSLRRRTVRSHDLLLHFQTIHLAPVLWRTAKEFCDPYDATGMFLLGESVSLAVIFALHFHHLLCRFLPSVHFSGSLCGSTCVPRLWNQDNCFSWIVPA